MRSETMHSINRASQYRAKYTSFWLLAAAICLSPAAAHAQTNTATGTGALANVTTGTHNTADGNNALNANTEGEANTASGSHALYNNNTGHNNTATGNAALYLNVTGNDNTANGYSALIANTADGNTATGSYALYLNTTGSANTASGVEALRSNTTGGGNTASGVYALYSNTSGNYNTASGLNALYNNTTGSNNAASGNAALAFNTTGKNDTASGFNALGVNTTGRNNVAVGASALATINGHNNIAVGANAGKNTTGGNNNIYIGHTGINGIESRVLRIGKAQTKTFIAGIAGNALSGATVVVRSNGQLGVVASSARYKQDIKPIGGTADSMAERLKRLRPISYRYTTEPNATHYGLIAEEVEKVMPELVVRDGKNRPESVQYIELVPLLLNEVQRQRQIIRRQAETVGILERRQRSFEARLHKLTTLLAATQRAALTPSTIDEVR